MEARTSQDIAAGLRSRGSGGAAGAARFAGGGVAVLHAELAAGEALEEREVLDLEVGRRREQAQRRALHRVDDRVDGGLELVLVAALREEAPRLAQDRGAVALEDRGQARGDREIGARGDVDLEHG